MTGSDEAGRRRKSHVRVVAHANNLTFASTKTELKRMRSKMSECYYVKVHGILGNGRRDVRDTDTRRESEMDRLKAGAGAMHIARHRW